MLIRNISVQEPARLGMGAAIIVGANVIAKRTSTEDLSSRPRARPFPDGTPPGHPPNYREGHSRPFSGNLTRFSRACIQSPPGLSPTWTRGQVSNPSLCPERIAKPHQASQVR